MSFIVEANKIRKYMLNFIRNSKIGIILAIVFGLSLFLIRGGNRYSGVFGVGANDIALVGETNISNIQFYRTLDLNKRQFSEMIGSQITNQQVRDFGIDQQSLGILINEAILKNEFKYFNLVLDDIIIAKEIREYIPSIYDENNEVIDENLSSFLYNQNLDLESFIDIIRTQTLRNQFENILFRNIEYPKQSLNNINIINNPKIKINLIKLPIEDFNLDFDKSEDLIIKYFEENINLYNKKESRTIEYINIHPKNFIDEINFSEFEIKEFYENNKNQFKINEKRSFMQLNFLNKDDASSFSNKINNINNYEEIKKIATKNNIRFNEYKEIDNRGTLKEIASEAFKLNVHELSEVIESSLAYHLVFIDKIIPSYFEDYNKKKNDINEILKNNYSMNYIQDLIEKIDEDLLNNLSINEIANKHKLKIDIINEGKIEDDFGIQENLILRKAFEENLNFVSNIYEGHDENSFFIFNVKAINPERNQDYSIVKEKVLEDWNKKEIINNSLRYIKEKVKDNNDNNQFVKNLRKEFNFEIQDLSIQNNDKTIPYELINDIFNNNVGGIDFIYYDKKILISLLKSINIEEDNTNLENLNLKLNNSISNELLEIYFESIMKETDIKINNNLFNSATNNTS